MWPFKNKKAELVQPEKCPYWREWTPWMYQPPLSNQEVIAMRREWDSPQVFKPCDASPYMNVADLYWKPWCGITVNQIN